jgi:hypothetical protein
MVTFFAGLVLFLREVAAVQSGEITRWATAK